MRADRLLSIVLLLQTHGQLTSRTLAERLEVSERTIHRDMEALSVSGIPVVAERGSTGGWSLLGEYRTNLTGLNEAEIQSLFVTQPPKLLDDLKLKKASEGALLKLLAALPVMYRQGAERARRRIHIDTSGWSRPEEAVPLLPVLQERSGPNANCVSRINVVPVVTKWNVKLIRSGWWRREAHGISWRALAKTFAVIASRVFRVRR